MKLIDMMQFDENGNYAGALDFDDPMWDQLMNQITLDEAIQFIEKAGDDFENIVPSSLQKHTQTTVLWDTPVTRLAVIS